MNEKEICIEKQKINALQQELWEAVLPGGMMGKYIEEGFPFYCINQKMLDYLGYAGEEEFVEAISGRIENCIHPKDRKRVTQEADLQLTEKKMYELEYRMQKKEGTYIWVQDVGKMFQTKQGRTAVISICSDITEKKKEEDFLRSFVKSMNGSIGNYIMEDDGRLTAAYISPGMGKRIGMSKEEYLSICQKDAIDCIYPKDREKVMQSILETIHCDQATSITFRARNKEGKYTWLNGSYSRCGEMNGKPMIRVVFTPVSYQFALQQDILHNIPGGICLYKWDGEKIYPLIVSDQFLALYGGSSETNADKISAVDFEYVYAEDLQGYKDFIGEIVQNPGRERNYTFRFWNLKEKRYVWICANTTDILQEDGTLLIYASYSNVDFLKTAEEKLRRNEELLEQTCGFAGVFTFFYDIETKIVYPGKTLQENFGLSAEEKNFPECMIQTKYIPEKSAQTYREMVRCVEQGDDSKKTDLLVMYSEEEKHWLRYEWKIIEYYGEKPKIAIGYAKIVDREKQLEAKIKMERQRLFGGDGLLLAYVVFNINQNQMVEEKTFYGQLPLVKMGMNMDEGTRLASKTITDPEIQKEFLKYHERAMLMMLYRSGVTSKSLEYRRRIRDGNIIWERNVMNLLQDPESGDLFLYEYCYNIDKEKLLEETMLAAVNYDYERFGSINLTEDQIGLLEADSQSNDYQLKKETYSILCKKYAQEKVVQEDRDMFLHNVSPENLMKNMEKTGFFEFVHREYGKDGAIQYKQDRHSYYDREKKICLITRSDITETIRAEEEKKEKLEIALRKTQEAVRAKTEFLSRMSHELRTPLNAISGYTTLLEQNIYQYFSLACDQELAKELEGCTKENLQHIQSIQTATKYLLAMIGDILDTQKMGKGTLKLVKTYVNAHDYMRNIEDMIQPEARQKQIQFSYERKTRFYEYYYLDGVRLQQILLNLLHNAIKFTPKGGQVRMTAEALNPKKERTALRFVVADTGIGMSKEFMEQDLYHAFSQENEGISSPYEGTGIGLSITRELVKLMDGEISCESEQGKGTTFTVTIFAETGKQESPSKRRRKRKLETHDLKGIKILLCEDNPMNQDMTKRLLKNMNCQVEVANEGKKGVSLFEKSEIGYYQMILMDLRMPVMDGFEATRRIRTLNRADAKKIPIIALSANAFEEDIRMALDSGMNEHLAKPVDARILFRKITEYCRILES